MRSRRAPTTSRTGWRRRPPAFFDETVRRQVEGLEKELAVLTNEADELAREIEELTGDSAFGGEGD